MINPKIIKGVIFDYGGTLDSGGDHWSEVIWDAYLEAGMKVEKSVFRDAYVCAERELAKTRHILPEHNFYDLLLIKMQIELGYLAQEGFINKDIVESKAQEIAGICYRFAKQKTEDAKTVLSILSKHYPLVLVSNFYGNIESVLRDFGLDKYFPKIIESAVVGVRKPDPQIFMLGVEALGMNPKEVLVVGDSYRKDIEPSEKIGCQTIWIKGKGWTPEEDAQTHPDIITDILQLPEKIGLDSITQ